MKFNLRCASNTEKIFETYPQIKENFKTEEEHWTEDRKDPWGKLWNIKYDYFYIHIKNVNDLLKLKEVTKQDLVITNDFFHPNMFQIIIYDDCLE